MEQADQRPGLSIRDRVALGAVLLWLTSQAVVNLSAVLAMALRNGQWVVWAVGTGILFGPFVAPTLGLGACYACFKVIDAPTPADGRTLRAARTGLLLSALAVGVSVTVSVAGAAFYLSD